MSDIASPEPKHVEPVVPAPDVLVPGLPHSGTLPAEMGGEKSVVEHPAPLRESILTAPDNPAGALDKPEKHKKGFRKLAIAGGALGLAAASLFAATRSDESSAVMSETPTTEEALSTTETTETPATETTATTEVPVAATAVEAKKPVSDDPNELLSELLFNYDCYRNTGDQACMKNYVADSQDTAPGSVVALLQDVRDEVVEHKKFAPDYNLKTAANITNHDFSKPNIRTIEFKAVQTSDDGIIQEVYEYDGLVELRGVPGTDEDGNPATLWLVYRQTTSNGRLISSN